MNKLVYSALALTLFSAPSLASENEWSGLDQAIENLSSSLSAQNNTGPKIGGWIISSARYSKDIDVPIVGGPEFGAPPPTRHEFGFQLDTTRVEITGDAGSDYSYKLSFEFAGGGSSDLLGTGGLGGGASLRDAYATFKLGDAVTGKMGNFKAPILRSALISDNRLLFLQRTQLGIIFAARQLGVQFNGAFDTVNWFLAVQNGQDGEANKSLFSGRAEASLMGNGAGKVEGAYGAGEGTNLTVGITAFDEGNVDKGTGYGADVALTAGPLSIGGEVLHLQRDLTSVTAAANLGGATIADGTTWDATVSYLFTEQYEAALRYEKLDDTNNTKVWTAGINRYVQGHDIKWLLQYARVKSDIDAIDGNSEVGLGLAVTF